MNLILKMSTPVPTKDSTIINSNKQQAKFLVHLYIYFTIIVGVKSFYNKHTKKATNIGIKYSTQSQTINFRYQKSTMASKEASLVENRPMWN